MSEEFLIPSTTFRKSPTIGALAGALAKAQGKIKGAVKDSANPFFKSKYADLASVRDACVGPLSENELAVVQFARLGDHGVEVETLLCHSSGEWVADTLTLPVPKQDAQGVGSAITYARRYALAAISGVAPEDDDGNAAAQAQQKAAPAAKAQADASYSLLKAAADSGMEALESVWKSLSVEQKKANQKDMPRLKAHAAQCDGGGIGDAAE